jgi:hypothetical protein
MAAHQKISSN